MPWLRELSRGDWFKLVSLNASHIFILASCSQRVAVGQADQDVQ
jgi:hypothetical protein